MRTLICILMIALLSGPALGLDLTRRALDYGVKEIGLSGGYLHVADTDEHAFEIRLRGGKMIGGGMELELETGWERTWGTQGNSDYASNALLLAGNFAYNIRTYASWMPFFLGGGGLSYHHYSSGDNSDSTTDPLIHFGAGCKFFFTREAALRIEYRFRSVFTDPDNTDSHRLLFGITAFLQ